MTTKSNRVAKADELVRYRPKPTLRIYDNELSSVKDMKVGKTYTFVVKAKVIGVRSGDEYGDEFSDKVDKSVCATLRVTDIKEE